MAGSTITGLGSGLDISSLVTSLVNAEKAPKQSQIERLAATTNTTLSAVGTLKSALETFQASVTSLTRVSSSFAALSGSSSKSEVATVTVGSGAVAGSYELQVEQLAKGSKVASQVMEDGASTTFASGSLTISLGSASYNVTVAEGASLSDIRSSINSQLSNSAGISANIVTDSSGSRLVLSSETMGEGTDLSVSGSNDSLARLDVDGTVQQAGTGAGYITKAQDAKFTLDGLSMTSATNTVSSAISGLSFKLLSEDDASTTITVGSNSDKLQSSIQTFVTAYNTLLTMTNALTKVSTQDGAVTDAGALVGDASVRTLLNSVRNALSQPSSAGSTLSQFGVLTQTDGTLAIDDTRLEAAASSDPEVIRSFFTGSDGLLERMGSLVEGYTKSGGILEARESNLNSTLRDLDNQQTDLDRRMEALETTLYSRYNKMDALLGELENTRNSLTSIFDAMAAQKDN